MTTTTEALTTPANAALLAEELAHHTRLIAALTVQYQPVDADAQTRISELASATVRLQRSYRIEAAALAKSEDILESFPLLVRIDRYRARAERSIRQLRKELDEVGQSFQPGVARPSTAVPTASLPNPLHKLLGLTPAKSSNEPKSVTTYVRPTPKVGRNEPCPCGSNRKFKQCCLHKPAAAAA